MHLCRAVGCKMYPPGLFCAKHWRMIPGPLQEELLGPCRPEDKDQYDKALRQAIKFIYLKDMGRYGN